ncbi:MAG: hypothetical protein ABIS47_02125 [Acidimicrobiales bacterium]
MSKVRAEEAGSAKALPLRLVIGAPAEAARPIRPDLSLQQTKDNQATTALVQRRADEMEPPAAPPAIPPPSLAAAPASAPHAAPPPPVPAVTQILEMGIEAVGAYQKGGAGGLKELAMDKLPPQASRSSRWSTRSAPGASAPCGGSSARSSATSRQWSWGRSRTSSSRR